MVVISTQKSKKTKQGKLSFKNFKPYFNIKKSVPLCRLSISFLKVVVTNSLNKLMILVKIHLL